MTGGQRLISWLHPCSTSNVALNTRISAHGPLMGHPNWAGCDIPSSRTPTLKSILMNKALVMNSPSHTLHKKWDSAEE
jgi:hypothetical protein